MKYSNHIFNCIKFSESRASYSYKALTVLVVLILFSFTGCQQATDDGLPAGDPGNGGLLLPDGFEAVVVADSIGPARELAINDNGDIYVKLRRSFDDGSIVALRDTSGNGKADIIAKFDSTHYDDGNFHTGLKLHNEYLYYTSNLHLMRYPMISGELIPDTTKRDTIFSSPHNEIHEHQSKALAIDNNGYAYVPLGAPSDNCAEMNRTPQSPGMNPCPYLDDHGAIWRVDADVTNQTTTNGGYRYVTGVRSMTAMNWNPVDEELYIVQHGRDFLYRFWPEHYTLWEEAILPGEEFLKLPKDGEFSWPYCYYDQMQGRLVLSPEYGGDSEIVGRCEEFPDPILGFPGHFAPNHLEFYTADQFPDHYKNGAFVALHGSYHRNPYPEAGYFVAFIPYNDGEWVSDSEWEVFANGFAGVETITSTGDANHRPTGLAIGPDGSLYISDGVDGKIWRVMYKGDRTTFGKENLARMEEEKRTANNIRTPDEIEDNLARGTDVEGQSIFATYCQACHQRDGSGIEGMFPSLIGSEWVNGDKDRLISVVIEGLDREGAYDIPMPSFGDLSDEEVAEVLTYIRQNYENDASAITTGEVRAVRDSIEQN